MTDSQLFELFDLPVTMPADASERIRRRVLAKVRRLRRRLWLRRVVVIAITATMLALAASGASGQVWCDPCNRVLFPIVHAGEVTR